MPLINAEAALKAVDKRLDKLEATVAILEKSVKMLIDTRGDSKADALRKLESLVRDQSKAIDNVPTIQQKALTDALEANSKEMQKVMDSRDQSLQREFFKVESELRSQLEKSRTELVNTATETDKRLAQLGRAAEAAELKRKQEFVRQQEAMLQKINDQTKAQAEAMRIAQQLEGRFGRLEALVQTAMAMAQSAAGKR